MRGSRRTAKSDRSKAALALRWDLRYCEIEEFELENQEPIDSTQQGPFEPKQCAHNERTTTVYDL